MISVWDIKVIYQTGLFMIWFDWKYLPSFDLFLKYFFDIEWFTLHVESLLLYKYLHNDLFVSIILHLKKLRKSLKLFSPKLYPHFSDIVTHYL